ncbi:MAG: hypothetical protein ACREVI_16985 [Steroidobacteraceae bacterium]
MAEPADRERDAPLPAYAKLETGHSMPRFEATWDLFVFVAAIEEKEAGRGRAMLRSAVGLREDSAEALLRYSLMSVDSHQARSAELMKRMCSKLGRVPSRANLAAALRDVDQQLDRAREDDVANLSGVLETAENGALAQWVEANLQSSMQSIKIDHASYFEFHDSDPAQILDELCGPYNATSDR